jgi:hypothetical protein
MVFLYGFFSCSADMLVVQAVKEERRTRRVGKKSTKTAFKVCRVYPQSVFYQS